MIAATLPIFDDPTIRIKIALLLAKASFDWGSVPDWLAGMGAIFALLFAGLAARAVHRTNEIQGRQLAQLEDREKERAVAERQAQSSRIAVWLDTKKVHGIELLEVFYSNTSGLPVYDVEIQPLFSGEISHTYRLHILPPTNAPGVSGSVTTQIRNDVKSWIDDELRRLGRDPDAVDPETGNPDCSVSKLRTTRMHVARRRGVRIQFSDCNGLKWVREADGRLYEKMS